jgi:hypothetical protein
MKKLFILFLLAVSATVNATTVADNDTLTILKPQKVRIITGDSIQKVKVYGRENDDKYTYESKILLVDSNYVSETNINKDTWNFDFVKKHSRGTGYPLKTNNASMRLAVGLTYGANAKYNSSQSVGSSWEIMWTIMEWEKFKYGQHNGFSIGFGVDWRNFRIDGRQYFYKANDGMLSEQSYPAGYEADFSRIKVFSLQIPMMWKYRTKKTTFGLGPVINFNTYASIKTRYKFLGDKIKHEEKNIRQRPVTIDWMLNMNIAHLPLYLKYSNDDVLKDGGVKFRSLSFGLYL